MMRRHIRGLTLIELLVAIVIFSLLGLMAYRAVYSATESQKRLSEEYVTWQRISRAISRVETELTQIGTRSSGQIVSAQAALDVTTSDNGNIRMVYWRMDDNQGARLSGLEYSNNTLSLLRWKSGDASQNPERNILLAGVTSFTLNYAAENDSTWRTSWPASPARKTEIPTGIRLEMEVDGIGRITRVFAPH
ncbi:type II secretion system protein GspJ [Uliginosibacterium gangwonense]|uniref:type II secretion system protein GspJ n=1 Tax=Uliginosibacterium gangwonense TaxID=392736 RepID=UPI00039F39E5|nr:type II secretion system protein GspJ [Uliginosibacterium gangwonense]